MKFMTIKIENTRQITLYDEDDFYEARERAVTEIDRLTEYLQHARKIISEFKSENIRLNSEETNRIFAEIRNDIYEPACDQYSEWIPPSGYCEDVLNSIGTLDVIANNLYNQERFAGKFEEHYRLFE